MAEVKIDATKLYKVQIVEYERGWGPKVDEVKFFDNELEAKGFVYDYNQTYNDKTIIPDWYMAAEYCGRVV